MAEDDPNPVKPVCPICKSTSTERLYLLKDVPVFCNILHETKEDAIDTAKGTIDLTFCQNCCHLFNSAFEPALLEYSVEYENSLHFSAKFQDFAAQLAKMLIEKYAISNKNVVEIGCGKGDFLHMICELGDNRGYGFDASYVFNEEDRKSKRVTFYQEFYSSKFSEIQADLVVCRHVLEHIHNPINFIDEIKNTVDRYDPTYYFEVPNALYTLRDLGIWDLIYEHYSYYNPHSLTRLLTQQGFDVHTTSEMYNKQFLSTTFGTRKPTGDDLKYSLSLEEIKELVSNFRESYEKKINYWKGLLKSYKQAGKEVVLWGGGSKGVTFLNVFHEFNLHEIVDINPRKQGKFVSGTGQRYISPEDLQEKNYDAIIIMNSIYTPEIRQQLNELNVNAELLEA